MKYYKAEDVINTLADQWRFEQEMEYSDTAEDIEEWKKVARKLFADLPTIEVSEEVLKATKKFNAYTIADENAEMGMRTMIEPIVEVSEDGEDYLRGYNDGWYAHEVITNAKLHIDKPRGFTLRTEKGYGNYSEDCISREYILGERFMSDEYNRETKSFDLPVVSVRDIEDAPSVVPSRAEGEWELSSDDDGEYGICSICGNDADFTHYGKSYPYCPNCGAKMRREK